MFLILWFCYYSNEYKIFMLHKYRLWFYVLKPTHLCLYRMITNNSKIFNVFQVICSPPIFLTIWKFTILCLKYKENRWLCELRPLYGIFILHGNAIHVKKKLLLCIITIYIISKMSCINIQSCRYLLNISRKYDIFYAMESVESHRKQLHNPHLLNILLGTYILETYPSIPKKLTFSFLHFILELAKLLGNMRLIILIATLGNNARLFVPGWEKIPDVLCHPLPSASC